MQGAKAALQVRQAAVRFQRDQRSCNTDRLSISCASLHLEGKHDDRTNRDLFCGFSTAL